MSMCRHACVCLCARVLFMSLCLCVYVLFMSLCGCAGVRMIIRMCEHVYIFIVRRRRSKGTDMH